MSIITDISENLQHGKAKIVKQLVQDAVDQGIPARQILEEGLLAGMDVIGQKFKNNEVFVPEVLVAARAMNMGTAILKPLLAESGKKAAGKVCIGTVKGDLHDIGKNLVRMMLEGKGLEVIDLGVDSRSRNLCRNREEGKLPDHLLLRIAHYNNGRYGDVVKAAEAVGIRDQVKIMVGRRPRHRSFC